MRPEDRKPEPIYSFTAGKLAEGQVSAAENGCQASRQKYWSELKEHERIDRLRSVVKTLESRLNMAEAFIRTLMEHKHDPAGALTGPLDVYRHLQQSAHLEKAAYAAKEDARNQDDVYF